MTATTETAGQVAARYLLAQIAAGAMDPYLSQIYEAMKLRYAAQRIDKHLELEAGQRVRVNDRISPKRLKGATGVIVSKDTKWVRVDLDPQHVWRSRDGRGKNMGFPASTLDVIE